VGCEGGEGRRPKPKKKVEMKVQGLGVVRKGGVCCPVGKQPGGSRKGVYLKDIAVGGGCWVLFWGLFFCFVLFKGGQRKGEHFGRWRKGEWVREIRKKDADRPAEKPEKIAGQQPNAGQAQKKGEKKGGYHWRKRGGWRGEKKKEKKREKRGGRERGWVGRCVLHEIIGGKIKRQNDHSVKKEG